MLIIRCTDNLTEVGGGYICMVGVRSLRHMTTMDMVWAMMAVGMPYKEINSTGFYNILSSLSIPRSALTTGADYVNR
jgi:hypothetical protein